MSIGWRVVSLIVIGGLLGVGCNAGDQRLRSRSSGAVEEKAPRMVIVDADLSLSTDDSNALLMLLDSRDVDIVGITTTSGNVWSEQATADTRRLLEIAGRANVPVHQGLPASHHRERLDYFVNVERRGAAQRYVGAFGELPSAASESGEAAIEFIVQQVRKHPGQVTFVEFGPATNLAAALARAPSIVSGFRQVYMIGGDFGAPGSSTPVVEFNFWFDPGAADTVLGAGLPLTLLPLDALENTGLDADVLQRPDRRRTTATAHARDIIGRRRSRDSQGRVMVWDEVLAAIVLRPEIVTRSGAEVVGVVQTRGPEYGAIRHGSDMPRQPTTVIHQVDARGVRRAMHRLLGIDDAD